MEQVSGRHGKVLNSAATGTSNSEMRARKVVDDVYKMSGVGGLAVAEKQPAIDPRPVLAKQLSNKIARKVPSDLFTVLR